MVLQQGVESEIESVWDNLKNIAKSYAYAEQGGDNFSGVFSNWPNSKYQMPGNSPFNNSNTFVRFSVVQAGLTMTEMGGSHPGENTPINIPDVYSDSPWREGSDPLPQPSNTP